MGYVSCYILLPKLLFKIKSYHTKKMTTTRNKGQGKRTKKNLIVLGSFHVENHDDSRPCETGLSTFVSKKMYCFSATFLFA